MKRIINCFKNYHPSKTTALLYIFIPFIIGVIRLDRLDNDFWFLIKTGEEILNNGFIRVLPFTIHEGFSYISQQWLSSIIFYFIYKYFSAYGVVIFTLIIFGLITFVFYKICNLLNDGRYNLSILLTTIFSSVYALTFLTTRPQIFDALILLMLLYLLEYYVKYKNCKVLIAVPILSILLINLHSSSWFMLFLFMIPYLLKVKFKIFKKEDYHLKPIIIVFVVSFILGIVNPYGIDAITYIFKSYGNSYINNTIIEMGVPDITKVTGIIVYLTIFLVILCYLFNKNKIKIRYFLLMLGTIYLGLSSLKGFQFFLLAGIFPLSDNLKELFILKDNYIATKAFKFLYTLIVILMVFPLMITLFSNKNLESISTRNIVNYLNSQNLDRNTTKIYTSYDDGAYLEYNDYKVYIDPRAELFLKSNNKREDIFLEYYNLQIGRLDIAEFLNKYDFDYLVVKEGDYLYYYFTSVNLDDYELLLSEDSLNIKTYLYKKVEEE